jgi:hypothetical protein
VAKKAKKGKVSVKGGTNSHGAASWEGERAVQDNGEGLKRLKQKLTSSYKSSSKPSIKKAGGSGLAAKKKKVIKVDKGPYIYPFFRLSHLISHNRTYCG